MGDEKRNAKFRIVVVKLQRHRHLSITMVDGAGGNALESAGWQGEGQRQAGRGQDLSQNGAPFIERDGNIGCAIAPAIGDLLRKTCRVESECGDGPVGLQNGLGHVYSTLVLPESRFPVFSSGLFVL